MAWDDELEQLALRVRATLGIEALDAALNRALATAHQQAKPLAYHDALKAELRRREH